MGLLTDLYQLVAFNMSLETTLPTEFGMLKDLSKFRSIAVLLKSTRSRHRYSTSQQYPMPCLSSPFPRPLSFAVQVQLL